MTEPDYGSYTVEELKDALGHINRRRYPERLARLQQELESREPAGQHSVLPADDDNPFGLSKQQLQWLKKSVRGVQLLALAIAINTTVWLLTGYSIVQFVVGLEVSITNRADGVDHLVSTVLRWVLLAVLFIGGLSLIVKRRETHHALAFAWTVLAVRMKIGNLMWWPSLYGWFGFNFHIGSVSESGPTVEFQLVVPPLLFAVWAMVTLRENDEPSEPENSGSM